MKKGWGRVGGKIAEGLGEGWGSVEERLGVREGLEEGWLWLELRIGWGEGQMLTMCYK